MLSGLASDCSLTPQGPLEDGLHRTVGSLLRQGLTAPHTVYLSVTGFGLLESGSQMRLWVGAEGMAGAVGQGQHSGEEAAVSQKLYSQYRVMLETARHL